MSKFLGFSVLLLFAATVLWGQVTAQQNPQLQKRLALVIGNGNYPLSTLANPENDAKDMSEILQSLGFKVLFHLNLDRSQMLGAIDDFGMQLEDYDVALLYYAGHGIQSEGLNYLVPVDAKLAIERMIKFDCVEVDRAIAYMEEAKTQVNIVILDACRNNPYEKSWSRALGGQGLAMITAPQGTLIAYATSPNKTASDGSGRNGLFTSAILESIKNPELSATQVFQNVTAIVLDKSNKQQMPWVHSSLTADFYFNPNRIPGQPAQTVLQTPVQAPAQAQTVITEPEPVRKVIVLPVLSAPKISQKTSADATLNLQITSNGGDDIIARGICYSLNPEPKIEGGNVQQEGAGDGDFSSSITGLAPNKTYYVRAYASNSAGTAYSPQMSFRTDPAKPDIKMDNVTQITATDAMASAIITNDGGAPILIRGFTWGTSPDPSASDGKTFNGKGMGSFNNRIMILKPDTTYYLWAYCTNGGKDTAYSAPIIFKTLRSDQFRDAEGNIYGSATFVNQTWMTENLKTTKLNDGTPIPLVIDKIAWRTQVSPAYCWYDNQEIYKETYGALYNLEAIKSGKLCPVGWHIPTDAEWEMLILPFGFNFAGGYLKEPGLQHWEKPNRGDASIYNRFNALPAGMRDENGEFRKIGSRGVWWSSVDPKKGISWFREMASEAWTIRRDKAENNSVGYSVRCVKDQN